MRRIDELLLVKELNHAVLRRLVDETHLLTALSPETAMAEFNYERLEFLGRSIVTLAT